MIPSQRPNPVLFLRFCVLSVYEVNLYVCGPILQVQDSGHTKLQQQFDNIITTAELKNQVASQSKLEENQRKNRDQSVLPGL